MDSVGRWVLFLAFLFLSFYFGAAETALLSIHDAKFKREMENRGKTSKALKSLLSLPVNKQIAWIDLSYLICLIAASYAGTRALLPKISLAFNLLVSELATGLQDWLSVAVHVLTFIVVVFVLLTITNTLPKKIYTRKPEQFLLSSFGFVRAISFVFRPLVFLVSKTAKGLASLMGYQNSGNDGEVTEEEIRSLVDAGEEKGVIEQEEREMINNIFDFDDKTASDLMTHRTDIIGVDLHAKISDIVYFAINHGFSRIPVYENDLDNIRGIIYVKDLLCLVGCNSSEEFQIKDFMREAIYVPEAKKCVDLFKVFKARKAHMAVVVDEYGGTAGIISMEDLLEAIVGNIQDEYDDEQEQIMKLNDDVYVLDGSTDLDDIGSLFDITLVGDEDTDTIGGLITDALGRIPDDGESPSVELEGIRFTVMVVEDRRVEKVKAVRITVADENSED